jgi:prenyltransferase beta subunit
MDTIRKHLEYIQSVAASEKPEGSQTLHGIYIDLNRLVGLYWIACSVSLLDVLEEPLAITGILEKRIHGKVLQHMANSPLQFKELGGPLRTLSYVQLIELLVCDNREKDGIFSKTVIPQIRTFVETCIVGCPLEKTLPFWFDMRGIYCLTSLMKLTGTLDCLTPIQRSCIIDYINRSQAILGGFGAGPRAEAHAGYTFCAVASLTILDAPVPHKHRLTVWLSKRLAETNGRVGKPRDSCYLWWVGATLVNLGCRSILEGERERIERFLNVNCFCPETGGISKYPSIPVDDESVHGKQDPDLFHTFLGISSLALLKGRIDPLTVLPSRSS